MQTKLIKSIQMILITLIIIVAGAIIVGILSNNDVMASTSHNLKPADYIKTEFYMTHTTYYVCTDCNYKTEKTEKCELINFKKVDKNTHEAQCKRCGDWYDLPHVDNDNNGKCDDCSYQIAQKPTPSKHICLDHSKEKIVVFDYAYHDYYAICTLCENPVPDWQKREAHSFGEYTSKGREGHSTICKICGYELIKEHEGASHENGGICTVKGCGYQYETHEKSTTLVDYTDITKTTHTPIYKCSHEGCNETFKGNAENHNYQNGKCVCGQEKIEEPIEIKIESDKYKIDDTYISNVQPKVSASDFKANIETNGTEINIYNKDNQLVSDSTKIGTGMKIEIKSGDAKKIFTIIVKGDLNGDGDVDFKDVVKINKARLNKEVLDEVYALAADVTGDGKVDFKDVVKINQFRLNKITEL